MILDRIKNNRKAWIPSHGCCFWVQITKPSDQMKTLVFSLFIFLSYQLMQPTLWDFELIRFSVRLITVGKCIWCREKIIVSLIYVSLGFMVTTVKGDFLLFKNWLFNCFTSFEHLFMWSYCPLIFDNYGIVFSPF